MENEIRRSAVDRRRGGHDRRVSNINPKVEKRSGKDRRENWERRLAWKASYFKMSIPRNILSP